ncbi:dipeptidyl aminopeptidase/acylaminoacyl peptidase [Sphingobacterium yanglingense]|uniref:Dipeptidyl aminopeptidase/acylaminoacyl peptidase n=2 Tax=Sphingobacterium yanglingense TaxID=1437280 RepID=A0A4R6WRF2_9SPHI|nr:dipeptidyl aminopeptidase/acylaminoacyl peptidase [Sphingobacterium yanglingense]
MLFKILFFCTVLPNLAVAQEKQARVEHIANDKVSPDGRYVTFLSVKDGKPDLMLKEVASNRSLTFEGMGTKTELTDEYFFGMNNKRQLVKVSLNDFNTQQIDGVLSYSWLQNQQKLLYLNNANGLVLLKPDTEHEVKFEDVQFYEVSPNGNTVLVVKASGEVLNMDSRTGGTRHLGNLDNGTRVKHVLWNKDGSFFYLIAADAENLDVFKQSKNKITYVLTVADYKKVFNTKIDISRMQVSLLGNKNIAFSAVGRAPDRAHEIEVWEGNSDYLGPDEPAVVSFVVADLQNGTVLNLAECFPAMQFLVHPFSKSIYAYRINDDLTKFIPTKTFYRIDSDYKKAEKLAELTEGSKTIYLIPDKPYAVYFNRNNWYLYDENKSTHKKLGSEADMVAVHKTSYFERFQRKGSGIFTDGQKSITVPVGNNILYYSFDGKSSADSIAATTDRTWYMDECNGNTIYDGPIPGKISKTGDYKDSVLRWHSLDHSTEGIAYAGADYKVRELVKGNFKYAQLRRSQRIITFVRESAQSAPELWYVDIVTGDTGLLYISNKHDSISTRHAVKYYSWKNGLGQEIGAIVRLPKGYDPAKKYPVIVDVYEQKLTVQNEYTSPFAQSMIGFNYHDYVGEGYIVIEPDIYYTYGDPGGSMLNCITEALNQLEDKVSIDRNNMGIIGHSFGGYETNYIVTATDMFKAAVSGAGIADIVNWYFSVNWERRKPEFWRYYEESFRIGQGFFKAKQSYLANSPILHAEKVQTPLLLWTGREDYHVDWHQSVSMFLALKDLGKPVNLLMYPKEGHVLSADANQKDLSLKIKQWFDYHLKSNDKQQWMYERSN